MKATLLTCLLVVTFSVLASEVAMQSNSDPWAGLDEKLVAEIKTWKKDSPAPARLLRFPDGNLPIPTCGLSYNGQFVEHYISNITDADLLKTLMFDHRADRECFHAARRRLLGLVGVQEMRAILTERRKANSDLLESPEIAVFSQLLASPFVEINVASLEKKDVANDLAVKSIKEMQSELLTGASWKTAYGKASGALKDKARSANESGWRTHLCYKYAGIIAPTGFDLSNYTTSRELKPEHIKRLFELKSGPHIFETADQYWLFHIEKRYD